MDKLSLTEEECRFYTPTAPQLDSVRDDVYQYAPIQSGEIRVLYLEPAIDFDAPLQCYLKHGPIRWDGTFQPYITLSYCWGKIKEDGSHLNKKVWCAGAAIPITSNLDTALRHIRQNFANVISDLFVEPGVWVDVGIWIDAMCINQANTLERNEQVMSMFRIYSNSSRLVVWLGLWSQFGPHHNHDAQIAPTGSGADSQSLLKSPWFSRRWVVQEYALTPIHSRFYLCEDTFIPCRNLHHGLLTAKSGLAIYERFGYDPGTSLLLYLCRFDKTLCSRAHDLVYSLVPIAQVFGSPEVAGVTIDYGMSVEDCFLDVARGILGAENVEIERLGPLLAVATTKRPEHSSLPSWVPDWRASSKYTFREQQIAVDRLLSPFEFERELSENARDSPARAVQLRQQKFGPGLRYVGGSFLRIAGRFFKPCFPPNCEHRNRSFNGRDPSMLKLAESCWSCVLINDSNWTKLEATTKKTLEDLDGDKQALFMIPREAVIFILDFQYDSCYELASCLSVDYISDEIRQMFLEEPEKHETITLI